MCQNRLWFCWRPVAFLTECSHTLRDQKPKITFRACLSCPGLWNDPKPLTVSFQKCSLVISWEATAHLWQLNVIILWKNVFWCHFSYYDWFQPPQEDFLEHSLTVMALELLQHSWHPVCVSDRHRRKGFRELSWTWGCMKEARWALFMGICF